uniref:Phosphatidylethanolamine-binding protein homolog F40A3.3 n=2 Tax=Cacopsylla melanoneura TaxID=428564 RepID=A0A8D8WCS9_9HEMI
MAANLITGLSLIPKCRTFLQTKLSSFYLSASYSANKMDIASKLKELEVIPDVIKTAPSELLKVEYPGNNSVNLGNELTPTQVQDAPKVTWNADPKENYLLCMTDPDAPSRKEPTFREWHHWLMGNIKGGDLEGADFLSRYIGAGPPPDTGLHRYVFLLYKQPKFIVFDETRLLANSADGRANFSISKFAEKYGLGEPIAVNFFQAKYDDYVPILYKQLGA